MIKYLLFDADDTLFDFEKCETTAFAVTCKQYNLDNSIYNDYYEINKTLWKMFDSGEITKEKLVVERYIKLFALHEITASPIDFNRDYLANLGKCDYLFDGAEQICKDLHTKYDMYIITNGVESTQTARFNSSPIHDYFRDIFISEKIGYQKPRKEYFDYVVNHTGINRDETLIIGDSLSSDIVGGNNAAIRTCWYNPAHKINTADCKCDYIIHDLNELRGILEI